VLYMKCLLRCETSELYGVSWFFGFARGVLLRLVDDDVSELFVGSIFKSQF
jgi:hypothetical protein